MISLRESFSLSSLKEKKDVGNPVAENYMRAKTEQLYFSLTLLVQKAAKGKIVLAFLISESN